MFGEELLVISLQQYPGNLINDVPAVLELEFTLDTPGPRCHIAEASNWQTCAGCACSAEGPAHSQRAVAGLRPVAGHPW